MNYVIRDLVRPGEEVGRVLCVLPESSEPVPKPGGLNGKEPEPLSDIERVIIQYVASMPDVLFPELPRPCTLTFPAKFWRIGKRRIYSTLRKLELLGVLSDNPDEAIQRATALLPRAMEVSKF